MMTLTSMTLAALVVATVSTPAFAQTPRRATYAGSEWGFFQYETGAAFETVMSGRPNLHEGQPEAVITIVSRAGRALTEADRDLAIGLAQGLCEQSGRRFNTQTRGHWLRAGGLGFQGACTSW